MIGDGTIITALSSVAVAALSFLSATSATRKHPPPPGPPAPELPPDPPAAPPLDLPPRTLRVTGAVDLTVTTELEGQPRMPPGKDRRAARRQRRRVRWGDTFTLAEEQAGDVDLEEPAEATPEPPEDQQVLTEETTPGDYAGEPQHGG